uniref:SAGA complex associated factor 29 n=1 Tax=Cavia porcellus TaxID=10141 RepID=A0A286X9I4_CAVPO
MQTENKISPYFRTKLRGLYTTAKADAEAECKDNNTLQDCEHKIHRKYQMPAFHRLF